MISEKLKTIINAIKNKKEKSIFKQPAKLEDISKFEKDNSITLPKQYKEFLLFSDGASLLLPAGVQFYGVNNKPLIDANDSDRPSEEYVVIGSLASGDPILFNKSNEKIAIFNHEAGKIEDDEIYDDFYSFLNDLNGILGIED